jgi:DNA-binding NtrC family response regulator
MKEPKDFNLLIVDDEDGIRKALSAHFEMDDYNIFTASGGYQAIEIVKKNRIDFVISDIRMPDGDGVMLLDEVRLMNPDIPIIVMMTGFAEITKEEAVEKGALDLLEKPIDIDLLEKYIAEAL